MILGRSLIVSDGIGFFILHGDIYEVHFSLLLRSTPFTIFSGPIHFRMKKRWKVLKSVEKGGFGHKSGF